MWSDPRRGLCGSPCANVGLGPRACYAGVGRDPHGLLPVATRSCGVHRCSCSYRFRRHRGRAPCRQQAGIMKSPPYRLQRTRRKRRAAEAKRWRDRHRCLNDRTGEPRRYMTPKPDLKQSLAWLVFASIIGFLVPAVFSSVLRWERSVFLIPYVAIGGTFLFLLFPKHADRTKASARSLALRSHRCSHSDFPSPKEHSGTARLRYPRGWSTYSFSGMDRLGLRGD